MTSTKRRASLTIIAMLANLFFAHSVAPQGASAQLSPQQQLLRDIYQELIEINTTDSVVMPVSSRTSRCAAVSSDSFLPTMPFGNCQRD